MNIEHKEVLKIVLQFLKESSYNLSYETLMQESKIEFNHVDQPEILHADIMRGDWNEVLHKIKNFTFSKQTIFNLQEKIAEDLIEQDKLSAAKVVIAKLEKQTGDLPEKENRIAKLKQKSEFRNNSFNKLSQKVSLGLSQANRKAISEEIFSKCEILESNLLVMHLCQSLQWLSHQTKSARLPKNPSLVNPKLILFRDTQDRAFSCAKIISMAGGNSYITRIEVDTGGRFLLVGFSDGVIEILDTISHTYSIQCAYQKEGHFLKHSKAIVALKVNSNSKLVASFCADSILKAWDLEKGTLLKKIQVSVSSSTGCFIEFTRQESCVAIFTDKIKIFGLNTGKKVNEIETNFSKSLQKVIALFGNDHFAVLEQDSDFIQIFDLCTCVLEKKISCASLILDIEFKNHIYILSSHLLERVNKSFVSEQISNFDLIEEKVDQILVSPNEQMITAISNDFRCILTFEIESKKKNRISTIEKEIGGQKFKSWKANPFKNQAFVITDDNKLIVFFDSNSFAPLKQN